MPDEKIADPTGTKDIFIRQTIAGTKGNAPLSIDEQRHLAQINLERATSTHGPTVEIIPPDIVELMKKQTVAGTGGAPELTEKEREKLTNYYNSRK